MRIATVIVQNAVRFIGLILIVLGFLFWTHHSYELVPLHIYLGIALVILALDHGGDRACCTAETRPASHCFRMGPAGVYFGMNMGRMLPGPAHEAIRVLHFFIGLGAIGLSESLAARVKRSFIAA